jgi:hypothetical protein
MQINKDLEAARKNRDVAIKKLEEHLRDKTAMITEIK